MNERMDELEELGGGGGRACFEAQGARESISEEVTFKLKPEAEKEPVP